MTMSKRIFSRITIATAVFLCSAFAAGAQAYGSYTPYSIFGFGDQPQPGTAFNKSMGGVGVATRNNRFINVLNPAAVTARDTLSFMADFSLYADNKIFKQGDMKSASNTFNINDCVISFPIYKTSAMMVGITPYSSTGYGYSFHYTDPAIISRTGDISYSASGIGALYDVFVAAGVMFWNRLSIGVQGNFTFGSIEKAYKGTFASSGFSGVVNGSDVQLNGFSGKFGVQYEQPLGTKSKIILGATYRMGTNFRGFIEEYNFSNSSAASDTLMYKVDTLANSPGKVKSPSELGIGICYKHGDNLMVEFDYSRSDWRNTGLEKVKALSTNATTTALTSSFSTSLSQSFRLGIEWTPNRNDVRYYLKRVSYRAGAYYKTDYFRLDGNEVRSMGVTLGATFPIFRWYNGLTIGAEFGRRGSLQGNMILENYFNFSVGVNIFDIWFQQPKYD